MSDEIKSGSETSEFSLTKLAMYAGIGLDAIGIALESLKSTGAFEGSSWLPATLVVVGTLLALLSKLGYTRSRTMLKLASAQPVAAKEVAAVVPLYKELLTEVKALRSGSLPTPPSGPPQP
jgi:hypothetical protein